MHSESREMVTREHPRKPSFQLIKQEDDKFFSKLLSKEIADSSFGLYDDDSGLSGSVPFFWESQPGTPRHRLHETTIPPLTPPPSYYIKSSNPKRPSSSSKKPLSSKLSLLRALFLRASRKKSSSTKKPPGSPRHTLDDVGASVFPPPNTTFEDGFHERPERSFVRGSSSSSNSSLNDGVQPVDGLSTQNLGFRAMR